MMPNNELARSFILADGFWGGYLIVYIVSS